MLTAICLQGLHDSKAIRAEIDAFCKAVFPPNGSEL